ncbi:MAG: EAL domain-containing protein [Betaproteobacteria bacterium]|nr:EAL domain-containing protein [Betaproteobacteria bacterium]
MAQPAPSPAQDLYLGRQPILDRKENLAAFELLFRSSQKNGAVFDDDVSASATVINHAFTELGIENVLGRHRGFINLSASLLMSDVIELLPKDKVVLEILETVKVTPQFIERCTQLKKMGFTLALDDFIGQEEEFRGLLEIVDIVKVDVGALDAKTLISATAILKRFKVKLLAEKVDRREQVDQCMNLGYELFQGYYFAKPSIITGKRLGHAEAALVRLLSLVLSDAPNAEIETAFKQNPDLSMQLLKLVNSVGSGVNARINSLKHALTVLGRRQLQRWLQILMFSLGGAAGAEFPSPLLILAATRGKLMELIAGSLRANDQRFQDQAFITGILSLVSALLGMPLAEILESFPLEAEVKAALLQREGALGAMLTLMESLEESEFDQIQKALIPLPALDHGEMLGLQVDAMGWANSIGEAN